MAQVIWIEPENFILFSTIYCPIDMLEGRVTIQNWTKQQYIFPSQLTLDTLLLSFCKDDRHWWQKAGRRPNRPCIWRLRGTKCYVCEADIQWWSWIHNQQRLCLDIRNNQSYVKWSRPVFREWNQWSLLQRNSLTCAGQSVYLFHVQSTIHQQQYRDSRISHCPGDCTGAVDGCQFSGLLIFLYDCFPHRLLWLAKLLLHDMYFYYDFVIPLSLLV